MNTHIEKETEKWKNLKKLASRWAALLGCFGFVLMMFMVLVVPDRYSDSFLVQYFLYLYLCIFGIFTVVAVLAVIKERKGVREANEAVN